MSNKTSDKNVANIEEKVKRQTENAIKYYKNIENIEELKKLFYSDNLTQYGKRELIDYYEKRIQELEEENRIQRRQINSAFDRGWIPKQKAKDILQKNRNELFAITYLNKKQYEPYEKQIERINKIETELLEGE